MTNPHPVSSILLTGASGQVGGDLLPELQALGTVHAPLRDELDLTNEASIRETVQHLQPRWIVNPAAYTAVDNAESDVATAFALNERAIRTLGEEAARCGAAVIHFSTDYVFDGSGTSPWQESDPTHPLGVYGASKLAGEEALLATGAPALIFRTSWVYGARGKNFLKTILRAAREREELRIVNDQWGAPTWSRSLARLVRHVIQQAENAASQQDRPVAEVLRAQSGVYHAADSGQTTWFGFAQEFLADAARAEPGERWARCVPVTSEEYPTPAKRPKNSRLNCTRLEQTFGYRMPTWQQSVSAVLDEIHEGKR